MMVTINVLDWILLFVGIIGIFVLIWLVLLPESLTEEMGGCVGALILLVCEFIWIGFWVYYFGYSGHDLSLNIL